MVAGYILDTCVLSETSRVRPHPDVIRFMETASNLFIPAAAIMEFQQGITQLCSRDPVKAVQLTRWYQNLMTLGMPILETGKEVAEAWGTLAADPKLRNLIVSHPVQNVSGMGRTFMLPQQLWYIEHLLQLSIRETSFLSTAATHSRESIIPRPTGGIPPTHMKLPPKKLGPTSGTAGFKLFEIPKELKRRCFSPVR